MRHPRSLLLAAPVAALALAACGGSSSSSTSSTASAPATPAAASTTSAASSSAAKAPASSGGGGALAVAADPGGALQFSTTHLTAKAGAVKISFTNKSPEGHNLTISTAGGQVVGSTPTFQGGTKTVTAHLKAGTYTFFCSVPGHRMAGMQGTLVVS
jgi:plastocyanin